MRICDSDTVSVYILYTYKAVGLLFGESLGIGLARGTAILDDSLGFLALGWHLPSSTRKEFESKANIGKCTWYITSSN